MQIAISVVSVLIAIGSLVLSGIAMVVSTYMGAALGSLSATIAYSPSCTEYQSRVLELDDKGFDPQEIILILNREALPNASDKDWMLGEGEFGSGYDNYYKVRCGEVELLIPPKKARTKNDK